MKSLTLQQVQDFLRSLASDYDVQAPIALPDGTRVLGRLDEGPLAIPGGRVDSKPTSPFFPQLDRIFAYRRGSIAMQQPVEKPLLVVGLTAEDADALTFIDEFFAAEYRDDVYFSKRDRSAVIVVSGRCGKDGGFLKIAGGDCDLEFVCDGERYVLVPYTEAGKRLAHRAPEADEVSSIADLQAESDALPDDDRQVLERASRLLQEDRVPEGFWAEIADRCIACTACNLLCPTCTCFEVFDWTRGEQIERYRLWDSCQLAGFMREASGHNPMGEEHVRTRRRIHHKLAADRTRWGRISCSLCGRCDDVCPSGIGIKAVTREIVRRFGIEKENGPET